MEDLMDNCQGSPHRKHCEFADASAEAAVRKTFAILGVDIDSPKQVQDFQDSLRFGERLRKVADHGIFAMAAPIAVAAIAALWVGIASKFSH
jgi:hypothetical protein